MVGKLVTNGHHKMRSANASQRLWDCHIRPPEQPC